MVTRRDELLQQLGITQWVLRRPAVLQGEVAISLSDDIRLLIVTQQPPRLDDPLLGDILRSMGLIVQQTFILTPEQVTMLVENTKCASWRLGISEPLALVGVQLHSPVLSELYQDAAAKRALWQQICHYEPDFYPKAS